MASDDEAGPTGKRIKLETTDPADDVRSINKLFPKIDNLEYFPLKVLLDIFTRLDHMDLYNLAETSCRFESIAKIVLNERYSHEYFIVDRCKHKNETYIDFFDRFGNEISAIEVKNFDIEGEDHWIASVLDKTKNLKKLTFTDCHIKSNENLLQQHLNENVTHLKFCNCMKPSKKNLVLSKFHGLQALEIDPSSIPFNVLEEVIRNNPALESLSLDGAVEDNETEGQLMQLICKHLKQLKEYRHVSGKHGTSTLIFQQPDHILNGFIDSLKHLETLTLETTADPIRDMIELLRRLNSKCKSVKHLNLYGINGAHDDDDVLVEVVKSFDRIESLRLSFYNECGDKVESLVEHLPFLRALEIEIIENSIDWSFVLALLRKCPSLEMVTLASDSGSEGEFEMFGTGQFHNQFIESIQNPNVKIQVKEWRKIIGSITKTEVIWRKKLVHWVGYDPSKNLSNINLLDLAKKPLPSASNVEHPRNPFDLILDYLDLKSRHSLSSASENCSQLVGGYMKRHSQQRGTFSITNEFLILEEEDYFDGPEMFAEYVINLTFNIVHYNTDPVQALFESFHNLKKLHVVQSNFINLLPSRFVVPQVRHLIYDEYFGFHELYDLSCICPNLETLKTDNCIYLDERDSNSLEFRKLKKITFPFNPNARSDISSVKILKAILKDMGTKLCLIY